MKVVCISDTHNMHRECVVPDGDVLIHAGDITGNGDIEQLYDFNSWLSTLPHGHKIIVAGNHDFCFERNPQICAEVLSAATYLQDDSIIIKGVKFYGSPWQPWFFDWAFNFPEDEMVTGETAQAVWQKIPSDVNVLITHGPAYGVLDLTNRGPCVGCPFLGERIKSLSKLKAHVFGHIHEGYGEQFANGIRSINASICNLRYQPINQPITFEI